MSFITLIGRISTISVGFIGLSSLNWLGGHGLYIILMVMSLIILLCTQRVEKETLGRAMDK